MKTKYPIKNRFLPKFPPHILGISGKSGAFFSFFLFPPELEKFLSMRIRLKFMLCLTLTQAPVKLFQLPHLVSMKKDNCHLNDELSSAPVYCNY